MLSLKKHTIPGAAVTKLLKYLEINIDADIVNAELEKHPDYPSLLSVSDVLTTLKIENSAFRLSFDELVNILCPFVTHTTANGGEFWVVNQISDNHVFVSSEKWNRHKLTVEEFKQAFSGVVLIAEPSSTFSTTKTFKTRLSAIKSTAIAIGALLLLAGSLFFHTGYFVNLNWQTLLLTVFKSAGVATSILLLVQSIDSNNPLIQVLCQTKGKTNCNAILSSKAAQVFEGLTWSEVGFFYFSGTWLLLLFGGGSIAIWHALALLNFVSLPYTVYSIYYQARIAKQWCVLCCTIQALLWLEFIPLIIYVNKSPIAFGTTWTWAAFSAVLISLSIPVILWIMLKPLLLKEQQLQPLKEQLRKFKYNTELFGKLLADQRGYAQPNEDWTIVMGNAEASTIITMVTNPYCPPCAKTHKILDELIERNDNLQARIVFTATNNDDDIKTPVSRHLMALNELADKAVVKQALNDWYGQKQKDYKEWAKVYPVQLDEANYHKLDKQNDWCQMAEVTFTPTLLLNGYRLPDLYQLPDLKYMLE
jgi:uncharacterized membrane protein